jgi:hypothetical protein
MAEKFGMRPGADKVNPVGIDLIDQQEVAPDVAFTVIRPSPFRLWSSHSAARGASLAMSNNMASLRRTISKRPEWDKRVQSFKKAFA